MTNAQKLGIDAEVSTDELTEAELDRVAGGDSVKAEAQTMQMLQSAISETLKSISSALQSAARNT